MPSIEKAPPPSSSSPHGLLGQCRPIHMGLNDEPIRAASAERRAIASIHRLYWSAAAARSPIQPWLKRKTSVGPACANSTSSALTHHAIAAIRIVLALGSVLVERNDAVWSVCARALTKRHFTLLCDCDQSRLC